MDWNKYIQELTKGNKVTFNPIGKSMEPIVMSGQEVTVKPVDSDLQIGYVVLCKVKGATYLHSIKKINGDYVQIGNNKGRINGWIHKRFVYGVME
jgi:hypothetical protein